jgi:hypothetical protein
MGCNTQKNSVIGLESNDSIGNIELLFVNNGEIVSKNIHKEYWETILNIIKTAEYDDEQYDEIKNPSGYMLKIREQDYIIKIFYANNIIDEILIWIDSDGIKINGKWYTVKAGKEELVNIINFSKL